MATQALITYVTDENEYKFCYVYSDGGTELAKVLKDKYVENQSNLDKLFKHSHVTYITASKIEKGKEDLKPQNTKSKAKARIVINSYSFVEYFHLIKDGKLQTFETTGDLIANL